MPVIASEVAPATGAGTAVEMADPIGVAGDTTCVADDTIEVAEDMIEVVEDSITGTATLEEEAFGVPAPPRRGQPAIAAGTASMARRALLVLMFN